LTLDGTNLKLHLAASRVFSRLSVQLKIGEKERKLQLTWHSSQDEQNVSFPVDYLLHLSLLSSFPWFEARLAQNNTAECKSSHYLQGS